MVLGVIVPEDTVLVPEDMVLVPEDMVPDDRLLVPEVDLYSTIISLNLAIIVVPLWACKYGIYKQVSVPNKLFSGIRSNIFLIFKGYSILLNIPINTIL
jgi:hypothetical protein